jgi:hypothetical protein
VARQASDHFSPAFSVFRKRLKSGLETTNLNQPISNLGGQGRTIEELEVELIAAHIDENGE